MFRVLSDVRSFYLGCTRAEGLAGVIRIRGSARCLPDSDARTRLRNGTNVARSNTAVDFRKDGCGSSGSAFSWNGTDRVARGRLGLRRPADTHSFGGYRAGAFAPYCTTDEEGSLLVEVCSLSVRETIHGLAPEATVGGVVYVLLSASRHPSGS